VSDHQTAIHLPSRLIDSIKFDQPIPDWYTRASDSLTACSTPGCCGGLTRPLDDPTNRVERERIIGDLLMRDFDSEFRRQVTLDLEYSVEKEEIFQSRIIELALGGVSLEEIASSKISADSHARFLAHMIFNRTRQSESVWGAQAVLLMGPTRLGPDISVAFEAYVEYLGAGDMSELIDQAHYKRTAKNDWVWIERLDDFNDFELVKRSIEYHRSEPLPLSAESSTTNLFQQIKRHILRGEISGEEWRNEVNWKESVRLALKIFSTSLRSAISTFLATTPTFGAIHRQFVRDLSSPISWISFVNLAYPAAYGEIIDFLDNGGTMKRDDRMVRQRSVELQICERIGLFPQRAKKMRRRRQNERGRKRRWIWLNCWRSNLM
jgi:hypothetical protein